MAKEAERFGMRKEEMKKLEEGWAKEAESVGKLGRRKKTPKKGGHLDSSVNGWQASCRCSLLPKQKRKDGKREKKFFGNALGVL